MIKRSTMMKSILSMLISVCILTGCTSYTDNNGLTPGSQNAVDYDEDAETDDTNSSTSSLETKTETELLMLIPNTLFQSGAATTNGYYYIQPGTLDYLTGQFRYVDYASGVDIPLSSQVNSTHSNSDDTSFIDSIIGDYRMFVFDDFLYFIRSGAYSYVDDSTFGDLAAGAVYRMNLDGSNRTLIYQSESDSDLRMYAIGGDDSLYLLSQSAETYEIIKISTKGGPGTVIASLPLGIDISILGASGNRIYLYTIGYDSSMVSSTGDGITYDILSLDVTNGNVDSIASFSSQEGSEIVPLMYNDKIIIYHQSLPYSIDICDSRCNLQQTISLSDIMDESLRPSSSRGASIIGNTLFIPCWNDQESYECNIVINLETMDMQVSYLTMTQSDGKDTVSAQVVAENETYYLAITATVYEDAEMPLGDGTSTTVQAQHYEYSLIPKAEFSSQSPSVKEIKRID